MNTSFLYPPAGKDDPAANGPTGGASVSADVADMAGHACCCPAQAMVRVVMPPTATRPHETELLLCGHHYRVSRRALAAVHAAVYELPWTPRDTAEWIHDDSDRSLAPVS
jgi:hypothetical protein